MCLNLFLQFFNSDTLTYVVAKSEGHIAPLIEPEFGDKIETGQAKTVKSWMRLRL
jgi:hypothetical protein